MAIKITGRGSQIKRVLRIVMVLSVRGYSIDDLATLFDVSSKTIRRDLHILESVDIPVYVDDDDREVGNNKNYYRVDPRWLSRRLGEELPGYSVRHLRRFTEPAPKRVSWRRLTDQ